jgi:threonyl-tRNA synthetase
MTTFSGSADENEERIKTEKNKKKKRNKNYYVVIGKKEVKNKTIPLTCRGGP